jgi:hypothetical protein
MVQDNTQRVLHVRFDGRSVDVALADLDVRAGANDDEIKRAVARYLDVAVNRFRDFTVDRHATGNVTLRPEAVFG